MFFIRIFNLTIKLIKYNTDYELLNKINLLILVSKVIFFPWISISRSFDGHKEIVLVATAKPIKQGLAPSAAGPQAR
jgi:hypothetical protein